MRILVTGITGFVGSHFAEYALGRRATVIGSRWQGTTENVDHLAGRLELVECDLRDPGSVQGLVAVARPDLVVHLAAQSHVGASWPDPTATLTNNIVAQVNLLETIRQGDARPRILVVGSGEEYGFAEEHELPLAETSPLRPLSPYGVSKVAQDLLGYQYWKSHGLPIVRSRAFTHAGPRRSDDFVESSFARQIARIEAGLQPPVIEVGNLKARRDYTDVRDVVRGYWLLLERGDPGEVYNLCSGRAWAIQAILDFLLGEARVRPIEVREDPARLRPADVPVLQGDPGKIAKAVGWRPEIPFEQTLRDVLAYWRERTAHG